MPNKIVAVIKREYTTRVRTKGFVASVFLMPMLMCTVILLPSFMAMIEQKTVSVRRIVVIDETSDIFPELKARIVQHPIFEYKGKLRYQLIHQISDATGDVKSELNQQVSTREIYAYLDIPKNVFEDGRVYYHAKTTTNFELQNVLSGILTDVVRNKRFDERIIRLRK